MAQRIDRYANLCGRENIVAGVDCGFSIHVGMGGVDPDVTYAKLKAMAVDNKLTPEERFDARIKLAELPRNSSPTRIRNRCELTGRPRAVYRKFKLSRLALRELASSGALPGVVKSSW